MEEQSTSVSTPARSSGFTDFYIPAAIIVAGAFIGAGLYFGGSSPTTNSAQNQVAAQQVEQPVDRSSEVRPVDDSDHTKGNADAPVTIVEYSDFDCPFCSRHHDTMNNLVQSGDVQWVYRHFPLESLHPQAAAVAVASECVAELGGEEAFWIFTDGYFDARGAGNNTAHGTLIPQLVTTAGVDSGAFTECFESARTQSLVQEDIDNAIATGGRGTPWNILIGPSGKTYPINGALPQNSIEQLIELAKNEA